MVNSRGQWWCIFIGISGTGVIVVLVRKNVFGI